MALIISYLLFFSLLIINIVLILIASITLHGIVSLVEVLLGIYHMKINHFISFMLVKQVFYYGERGNIS